MNLYELQPRFAKLFSGLDTAFGTGRGGWVKRPPRTEDWLNHLEGRGPGMGIAPLRPDNTVLFAAIDLDEPDFKAALDMQRFLPGASYLERSRSGNAHVWVFFRAPLEAWVAMGILKEAVVAAGKQHVEVFPKNHDFERVQVGNYINLPFHGNDRPILRDDPRDGLLSDVGLEGFITSAERSRNDPEEWRKRARWLLISPPSEREPSTEFGKQRSLHICAEHIIENADTNPVREGHRASVYFALAKQLTNCELYSHDEALAMMQSVNDASPDRVPDAELRRILGNAERGRFTSTGCDDPLFAPYRHPSCPIANPNRRT